MKISRKKIFVLFIFVVFILIQSISYATYQTVTVENQNNIIQEMIKNKAELSEEEERTLELINEYRKQNGLRELKPIFMRIA